MIKPNQSCCGDGIGTINPTNFREGGGFLGQENYNTPVDQHTRSAIPPATPILKGIPSKSLLVKVAFRGVF